MQGAAVMSARANTTEAGRLLERLARAGSAATQETSVVTSPGARTAVWAVKVKSNSSYNLYNVRVVEIGQPGSAPTELGSEMQAFNLAESFTETGGLSADTFVVMCKVGNKNVFYAPV